jgi:Zn-dependent peptidase ImmA (M78 family)
MDKILVQRRASQLRERLHVDPISPIDLFSIILSENELTLIHYPFQDEISGICLKEAKVIAINSKSTLGRQAFSLAHELYHYYFDDSLPSFSYFSNSGSKNKVEMEADLFASYLLMPDSGFFGMVQSLTNDFKETIHVGHLLELEQFYRVSRKAVLTRLQMEGWLTELEAVDFTYDIVKTAKRYGYDTSLYLPCNQIEPKTYGAYLKRAADLRSMGLISEGKYEEYLLDAFRSDIVYDDNGIHEIYD